MKKEINCPPGSFNPYPNKKDTNLLSRIIELESGLKQIAFLKISIVEAKTIAQKLLTNEGLAIDKTKIKNTSTGGGGVAG